MKLLLDIHVLLGLFDLGSVELSNDLVQVLISDAHELHVSTASLWEIALKARSRRLEIGLPLEALPDACDAAGASILAIQHRHVLAELDPLPPTRDPFDRLLLTQSTVEGMQLDTVDRALQGHPAVWARPARNYRVHAVTPPRLATTPPRARPRPTHPPEATRPCSPLKSVIAS